MITNRTFDEIQIGATASMQRTLTKQDIDIFGLLCGDMNPTHFSDEYAQMLLNRHKVVGHSMWGGALISSLLGKWSHRLLAKCWPADFPPGPC